MIAVKSLTGREHHLEGEIFSEEQDKWHYKTSEPYRCWNCSGAGVHKQWVNSDRNDVKYIGEWRDIPCRYCRGVGAIKSKVRDWSEKITVTRQRSLCGHAILRPKTKQNIRELVGFTPDKITDYFSRLPCCPACISVYRMMNAEELNK